MNGQLYGGMKNFRLSERIADNLPGNGEVYPISVIAADSVVESYRTDSKTGLLNQQAWTDNLGSAVEALMDHDSLVVAVSDLDHFKEVNDSLGHNAGDELLGIVGQAYKQAFQRSTDVLAHGSRSEQNEGLARLGGDEYAVYVINKSTDTNTNKRKLSAYETMQKQADEVNNVLAGLLSGTKFERFGVKVSTGIAEFVPGDTVESVFAKADMEMFSIK